MRIEFVTAPNGLFPLPFAAAAASRSAAEKKSLSYFRSLGQFCAKALLDFRVIDIPLSPVFWRLVLEAQAADHSILDVFEVDEALGTTLMRLSRIVDEKKAIYADASLVRPWPLCACLLI